MNPFLSLAAAALLAQPGEPAPRSAPAATQAPVQVEAGTIAYDAESDRYDLAGGVTLKRGEVTVRARTARYDAKTGEVDAAGNVLLLEPGRVVAADGLHAIVDGPYEARQVVAFFKDRPLDLSAVRTLDEVRRTGRNRVTLRGSRVTGEVEGDRFEAYGARISLCDCGDSLPSWEIRARHADVIPGKRAILTWPVIYITPRFLFMDPEKAEKMGLLRPIPLLPLPWLYVPLADRQTGLLFPELSNTLTTGWAISQPLFVTLGRSWDATVTADYAFGAATAQQLKAAPGKRSVRGPGVSFELRWAPVEGAAGSLRVIDLHDLERTWRIDSSGQSAPSPPHGERLSLSLRHAQRFSDSTFLDAEVAVVNDANYQGDFTGDALLRNTPYGRSALAITHRTQDWLLEGDAAYHIPLTNVGQQDFPVDPANGIPRVSYGLFGSNVPVFHRLPSASATLLPVRLAGPLFVSGSAGIARFAPIHGVTGDEGAGGIGPGDRGYPPPSTVATAGALDGQWQPGERLAATRLALRTDLRAPLALGRYLAVEPWARVTALQYAFETAAEPQLDGWLAGGVTLSTRLTRSFGEGASRIRHVVEPRMEWAWGGLERGPALPAYAYDELDAPRAFPVNSNNLPLRPLSAMPPGGFQQLRLALRNRLVVPSGTWSRSLIDLDLGQDFDLMAGTRSETYARAGFDLWPVSGSVLARFYAFGAQAPPGAPAPAIRTSLDSFTELRVVLAVKDRRGDDIHGSLLSLGAGASPQTKAGIDSLFDRRPIDLGAIAQGQVGARVRLSGLDASYDMLLDARSGDIQQHVVTLVWTSPCNCWKLGVTYAIYPNQGTAFQFLLDLSQFTNGGRFSP